MNDDRASGAANPLPPVTPPGAQHDPHHRLARHIGLGLLVLYGVGDMVGAGIYATIGTAAGELGNAVWLAFIASMCAAMLTGLSYACLASRYPRAAGAAYVTQRAFNFTPLAYVVGLAVMASGLTSMGTSSNAFANSLLNFLPESIPPWSVVIAFIVLLTAINLWGIRESMWANAVCTLVEVGGLLFIIAVGMSYWGGVDYFETPPAVADDGSAIEGFRLSLILSGAVLTFFAFVGFEDMLNIAEEVKEPRTTMPWGIVLAIVIATVLYMAVAITAVSVVPYTDLANKELGAPLAQISEVAAPWLPGWVYVAITIFAVGNTALINYVMGSRLAYGMARQGLLPAPLGRVHRARRTPHVAILTLAAIALVLALSPHLPFWSPEAVGTLAKSTSLLLLSVFAIVNAALVVLKLRPGEAKGAFEVPLIVPVGGILFCGVLISRAALPEIVIAGVLLAVIVGLYFVQRPTALPDELLGDPEEGAVDAAPTAE